MPSSPNLDLIRCPELSDRAPYAYASVATGVSRLIFSAGACPIDRDGTTVSVRGIRGQAEKVMDNLEIALAAAGAGLSDVVKTTVYVASTHRDDLATAWEVVRRRFGDHDPPSTLVGVSVLGYRDQLVEIEAIAAQ
jgi:enamine deaminase RidA (YjgF/YER057c/UK114 family)